jgi:adenylate cyclase
MPNQRITRRLTAVLAADVAGYSSMMESDESATLAALRQIWPDTFNLSVAAHHGRIVKMMGDGALVEFASAVEAVECAADIRRRSK